MKGKKTRSSAKRPGIQFLLAAGCGCGALPGAELALCGADRCAGAAPGAGRHLYQRDPGHRDVSGVQAGGPAIVPKWAGSLGICACYLGLMLVGNLCLAQPDLELILLNSGILCGAALLALLPMPQRRRGYRVRY